MAFDAIAYINEPRWRHSSLGLDRISLLLEKLGNPQSRFRSVHVAGTNGKGSICAYLSSILCESGLKTGLFTSPYIERFEERIQVDGEVIGERELCDATLRVRDAASAVEQELGEHPTEFELMCAVAFVHFANAGCDIAVVECGLGGRLDATNVVEPELCVIARIGMDHTDILGDTLSAIAAEKAGIIKPGVPVVSWPQEPDAMEVIRTRCEELGCKLIVSDFVLLENCVMGSEVSRLASSCENREQELSHGFLALQNRSTTSAPCRNLHHEGLEPNLHLSFRASEASREIYRAFVRRDRVKDHHLPSSPKRAFSYKGHKYQTSMLAAYQPMNAAVAIDAACELGIKEEVIDQGIAKATWPGRFEVVCERPLVIIDGAHNPQGALALTESLEELMGASDNLRTPTFVMGVLADKDYEHVIEPVLPMMSRVITYAPDNPRALPAEDLKHAIESKAQQFGKQVIVEAVASPEDAIKLAVKEEGPEGFVVSFGTLYAIGSIKQALRKLGCAS